MKHAVAGNRPTTYTLGCIASCCARSSTRRPTCPHMHIYLSTDMTGQQWLTREDLGDKLVLSPKRLLVIARLAMQQLLLSLCLHTTNTSNNTRWRIKLLMHWHAHARQCCTQLVKPAGIKKLHSSACTMLDMLLRNSQAVSV